METRINMTVLEALNDTRKKKDDLSIFDAAAPGADLVMAALDEINAGAEKKAAQEAAQEIIKINAFANESIAARVANIRALREQIERDLATLKLINHAQEHSRTTMDFVPLARILTNPRAHWLALADFGLPPYPVEEKPAKAKKAAKAKTK